MKKKLNIWDQANCTVFKRILVSLGSGFEGFHCNEIRFDMIIALHKNEKEI